ncbi:unnamed protein product [Haemonchus placei]|uniref:Homeobox domain-containing protein n=1 Tax=Haemonchus placei TaxID=6290 RepID=A0A0N4VTI6_HAEPC|nr:unnamed protein product [Haemonchus placei]
MSSMVKTGDSNIWSPRMMPFWCSHNATAAAAAAVDFTAGGDKQSMLHQTTFDALPAQSFYPARWPAPPATADTYPEQPRWNSDHVYPMFPFVQSETYPSDPFPSTSVSGPMDYKVNAFYPNAILGSGYPTDYNQFTLVKTTVEIARCAGATEPATVEDSALSSCRLTVVVSDVRVRTSDKYRMVYSDYQRLELEKEFCTSTFVTSERKAELSTLLNLTERQIKIWFQNR